jgi:alginate O-acetyltransferase complex protein AlgJ
MLTFSPLTHVIAFALFAIQTAVGALFIARPLLADVTPALFRPWMPPLLGMRTETGKVDLTLTSVFDGGAQREAEAWVAEHLPQRDVFRTSYMANRTLVRGRDGVLFEQSYIFAYCGIQPATDVPALPAFAHRLRVVEDWFRRRGKVLVYFTAPTKTSWYPNAIPSGFPCPVEKRDTVHASVLAALQQAHVDFVDGRAALEAARDHFPVALFPVNGIHWNWLGTAIGVDALLTKLRELGLTSLPSFQYQVKVVDQETGYDRDLSDLLNLVWPPPGKPAPEVSITPSNRHGALLLAAVNDSFFQYLPVVLLDAAHLFRAETVFGYMNIEQRRYQNSEIEVVHADDVEIARTLLTADVVVLEEVESRIGGPFALRFLDLMEAAMARDAASGSPVGATR